CTRKRNRLSIASFKVRSNCSSLMSRNSLALIISGSQLLSFRLLASFHHADFNRHLVRKTGEANPRGRFAHARNFVKHRSRSHHRGPEIWLTLTLTHAGFERDRSNRFVG